MSKPNAFTSEAGAVEAELKAAARFGLTPEQPGFYADDSGLLHRFNRALGIFEEIACAQCETDMKRDQPRFADPNNDPKDDEITLFHCEKCWRSL